MAVAGWRWQVGMVGLGLGLIQQTCIIYHCNRQWLTQQGSPSKAGRQCRARVGPPEAAGLPRRAGAGRLVQVRPRLFPAPCRSPMRPVIFADCPRYQSGYQIGWVGTFQWPFTPASSCPSIPSHIWGSAPFLITCQRFAHAPGLSSPRLPLPATCSRYTADPLPLGLHSPGPRSALQTPFHVRQQAPGGEALRVSRHPPSRPCSRHTTWRVHCHSPPPPRSTWTSMRAPRCSWAGGFARPASRRARRCRRRPESSGRRCLPPSEVPRFPALSAAAQACPRTQHAPAAAGLAAGARLASPPSPAAFPPLLPVQVSERGRLCLPDAQATVCLAAPLLPVPGRGGDPEPGEADCGAQAAVQYTLCTILCVRSIAASAGTSGHQAGGWSQAGSLR